MGILELQMPVILYPKPNHTPASFTVLNFRVNEIEKVVNVLTGRGVMFEQYGAPIETDKKVSTRTVEERMYSILPGSKIPMVISCL